MKKKITILGGLGRMGREVVAILLKNNTYQVSILDNSLMAPSFEKKVTVIKDFTNLKTDVLIDFSSASCFKKALNFAYTNNISFISGTTNLTNEDIKNMKEYSLKIPIIYSENFSIGIALLKKILKKMTKEYLFEEFEIQLEETHHKNKKDSPSGTAKMLRSIINKEISIKTFREESAPGTHTIILTKNDEKISISHELFNRRALTEGVIKAIDFIKNKNHGFYSLEDIF